MKRKKKSNDSNRKKESKIYKIEEPLINAYKEKDISLRKIDYKKKEATIHLIPPIYYNGKIIDKVVIKSMNEKERIKFKLEVIRLMGRPAQYYTEDFLLNVQYLLTYVFVKEFRYEDNTVVREIDFVDLINLIPYYNLKRIIIAIYELNLKHDLISVIDECSECEAITYFAFSWQKQAPMGDKLFFSPPVSIIKSLKEDYYLFQLPEYLVGGFVIKFPPIDYKSKKMHEIFLEYPTLGKFMKFIENQSSDEKVKAMVFDDSIQKIEGFSDKEVKLIKENREIYKLLSRFSDAFAFKIYSMFFLEIPLIEHTYNCQKCNSMNTRYIPLSEVVTEIVEHFVFIEIAENLNRNSKENKKRFRFI